MKRKNENWRKGALGKFMPGAGVVRGDAWGDRSDIGTHPKGHGRYTDDSVEHLTGKASDTPQNNDQLNARDIMAEVGGQPDARRWPAEASRWTRLMLARNKQTPEDRFRQIHSECCTLAQEIIDARVKYLKACHADLPEPTLRQEVMKHRYCLCAIANEVLDTPAGG